MCKYKAYTVATDKGNRGDLELGKKLNREANTTVKGRTQPSKRTSSGSGFQNLNSDPQTQLNPDPEQCPPSSVADPGSWILCLFDPGSGTGFFRIPDLGSQAYIFKSLMTSFWIKITTLVIWLTISFTLSKIKLFTIS